MQAVTTRQQAVLDVLDEEIKKLEVKLAKAQPLIDELSKLKRTRATLLSERSVTGGISSSTRLTMNEVIHTFREADGAQTPQQLATALSVDVTVVRSHLNRYKDERYQKNNDGSWDLIGEDDE